MIRKVLVCAAAAMSLTVVACSKSSPNPTSPSSAVQGDSPAAADGSTLKVSAPGTTSPTGGGQVNDPVTLVASTSSGTFTAAPPLSYRFQVRSGSTVISQGVVGPVNGGSVSFLPSGLQPNTNYTWRVQATLNGKDGPWSSDASFRSSEGAFIRGNEVRDPLTIGRTVGSQFGPTAFVPEGLELRGQDARVVYQLPQTLEAGEFSVMVTGFDEGSPGDKSKIMSMQEGFGDITTNDYRFTVEKRGRDYVTPGAVTFRMINGNGSDEDFINDGNRVAVPFSDERWYFWKVTWNSTSGTVEVREDSPTGRVIYRDTVTTNGHAYRPQPHVIWLGAPVGRAGPQDASIPGTIYKNVYVGPGPRPAFPGE